ISLLWRPFTSASKRVIRSMPSKMGMKAFLVSRVTLRSGYVSRRHFKTGRHMATSPMAESRITRIWPILAPSTEYGVKFPVVVHLHLFIDFHVLVPGLDVGQQLIDGHGEVLFLFQQHLQFFLALL